jgi:hypothetical protein
MYCDYYKELPPLNPCGLKQNREEGYHLTSTTEIVRVDNPLRVAVVGRYNPHRTDAFKTRINQDCTVVLFNAGSDMRPDWKEVMRGTSFEAYWYLQNNTTRIRFVSLDDLDPRNAATTKVAA